MLRHSARRSLKKGCRQTREDDPLCTLNLKSATRMVAASSSSDRISIGFRLDLKVWERMTKEQKNTYRSQNNCSRLVRIRLLGMQGQERLRSSAKIKARHDIWRRMPSIDVNARWRQSLIYSHWQVGFDTWELMAALTSISSSCAGSSSAAFGTWSYLVPPNQPSTTVILYEPNQLYLITKVLRIEL